MYTQTTRFQPVMAVRSVVGTCPVCGKRTTRRRTFEHTINPFNRNADGQMKSYDEVRADVNAEADAWDPDFTHAKCAS